MSFKKVLLVNTNLEKAPYPVPPLGLCLLAARLEHRYEVKIYDGVFDEGRELIHLVQQFQPDFIGFSIRNIDDIVMDRNIFYPDDILSKFILPVKSLTHVPIILGGSGFSIFPEEMMRMTGADFGIVGEGEELLPQLLDDLVAGKEREQLPKLMTADGRIVQNGQEFSEMDQRIDFKPYLAKGGYSIQTKRGCSHGCIYCTYPCIEGSRFRTRNPSDIADEIEQVHRRLGYLTFEFVDSTFNDPQGHAESICREIIKKKIKVRLRTMGINPRHTSEALFELMLEAGFRQIDATPDSASPVMLKNLNKGFDRREIEKMAGLIKKYNLPTMWFFLFGGPGENPNTFHETVDFIDSFVSEEDMVYMTAGLRIYPNTPLYQIAIDENKIKPGQSILRPPAYYYPENFPKTQIDELMHQVSLTRNNCIPAMETSPPSEMIQEALVLRRKERLDEPFFRTLLRIRKKWRLTARV
ncbi:MAG: radical SAM protein [Bacteroidales bacterium]|nr:radical SAM protein [Bacteroidales bacterium]